MTSPLSRRMFLRVTGASALVLVGPTGCASRPDEAYEPWAFPDTSAPLEQQLVGAAILAANPHNTQPWWFRASATSLELHRDPTRTLGPMDGLDREAFIGLGCAVENVMVAARALGRSATLELLPDAADPDFVARFVLSPAAPVSEPLYAALATRHTDRGGFVEMAPPAGLEAGLRDRVDDPAVELSFLGSADEKRRVREATVAATRAILADTAMSEASHAWYRHSADDIRANRDGTTLDATGSAWLVRTLGHAGARPSAVSAGEYWLSATEGRQATAAAYVILSTRDRNSRLEQLRTGRIFQRLHLWATTAGLAVQPLNQLPERQDREEVLGLEPTASGTLAGLTGRTPSAAQMLFRIGVSLEPATPSPRRPVAWMLRSA